LSRSRPLTERHFGELVMPTASHPAIRKLKRRGNYPSIHGNKLWKSSCLLMDYLVTNPPEHTATVVDAGCGWGACGIWCAKALGSEVTSLDADPDVFPFLEVVATLNEVSTTALVSRFDQLSTRQLSGFDMLIAADICFWDELVDPVYNMINRAVTAGVKQIVIADPERPTFHEVAQRCVDRHCAELFDWESHSPTTARGAILVIHNA